MTELVERYVHQVGRYLPPKERAEIEAELRSQIQDQLDDRYAGTPTEEEVAAVLKEFGHPYGMAASYNRDQYLVGPDLYPYMMLVLRYVWVIVPTIVLFLNIFGALVSPQPSGWFAFLLETIWAALQTTLILFAVVVLIFAMIHRIRAELDEKEAAFDPLNLPKVDDPRSVDRFETLFGISFGTVLTLVFLYFLSVGGLTLRFNLSDPGEVIPVPTAWLILLIAAVVAQVIVHLLVLRRSRWSIGMWLAQTVLEVFGMICLYFAVLQPGFTRIVPIGGLLEIGVVLTAVLTLVNRGSKLVRLWNYRASSTPFTVKAAE